MPRQARCGSLRSTACFDWSLWVTWLQAHGEPAQAPKSDWDRSSASRVAHQGVVEACNVRNPFNASPECSIYRLRRRYSLAFQACHATTSKVGYVSPAMSGLPKICPLYSLMRCRCPQQRGDQLLLLMHAHMRGERELHFAKAQTQYACFSPPKL